MSPTHSPPWHYLTAPLPTTSPSAAPLRLAYIDCPPPPSTPLQGTLLLLHGFPQTSHQFRHVISPFSNAGYRTLAPDYRGAGRSSKPTTGFTKSLMAQDMLDLLSYLDITSPVHVVGHDIGGMIAYALACRFPNRVASVAWGECPLPGTTVYERERRENAVQQFHFIFHSVPDLPEALVAGRERMYLGHFFDKICYNAAAVGEEDLDYYAREYAKPGAMRCAFEVYRAFEKDKQENKDWMGVRGKCKVPAMVLSGEISRHKEEAEKMFMEVHEEGTWDVGIVAGAGHYLAEENPEGFVKVVLAFIEKHPTRQVQSS